MDAMAINWRPWARPRPSSEARRALEHSREALKRSERELDEVRGHWPRVTRVSDALTLRIELNHFGQYYEQSARLREGDTDA